MIATLVLLLNLFIPLTGPLTAYASTENPVEDSSTETSSILEVLSLENEENDITTEGFIVGYLQDNDILRDDFVDDSNIALADDPEETDLENMLFVELPETSAAEYGLDSNPELLGEQVTLTGSTAEYLGQNGLVDVSAINLVTEEDPEPEIDEEPEAEEDVVEEEEATEEDVAEEPEVEGDEEATEEDVEEEATGETIEATAFEDETPVAPLQEEFFELPIMHMNDTHARVDAYPSMVTAVNSFRNENPEALLLHAGDVFSGTLYFNEFLGQADLELLNLMGIDAFAFGNHEFDLGDSEDGHGALADFVENANFPFLGTNVDFSNDADMDPYDTNASLVSNPEPGQSYDSIVHTVDGEEIGIFGLTTEDTANIASPVNISFTDYIGAAEDAVAEFEAEGIDKVVAVTHMGYDSAPAYGNDIVLANQVDGIDVIVGGHSHTALAEPVLIEDGVAPTVIVQAGANAENLGTLNVTFNDEGEIVEQTGELLSVADYEADPEAVTALEPYQEEVEEINNEEIGANALKDLENPRHGDGDEVSVRANETELGNLVTDAMLAKTQELYPDTVIAFQNGGGVRAPIDEGPITVGEVIEVLPFGNNPVIVELSGQEIKDIFEISVGANERPEGGLEENGGFLQVSGMEFYYDSTRESGDRIAAMFVEQDGELNEVQLDENYLVTTNAFTGQGGDGLTPLEDAYDEGRVQDTGAIDWEQLRDYMIEEDHLNGEVDPVLEGRINDLRGEDFEYPGEDPGIDELQERIEELEEALRNLETENAGLVEEINALQELIASLRSDLEAGNAELAELEQRIANLEERLVELEEANGESDEKDEEGEKDKKDEKDLEGKKDKGKPKDSQESKTKDEEKSLPETGSASMIITVIGGTTLLVSGFGVEAWRRKKSKK